MKDTQTNNEIAPLDIMTATLSYLAIKNYDENVSQSKQLDTITFDIEHKLEYQNKILNEILRKVGKLENGIQEIHR